MITAGLLRLIMPRAFERADLYAPHLEAARVRFVGDDRRHVGMWLAQIAHESGELRHVLELADGAAYEGRASLGNTQPGDGPRFKGRGLIQLTGRDNYRRAGAALGLDLLAEPELLERPEFAAASAGWFWQSSGCALLMQESADPLAAVTRRINGGFNGLEDRRKHWRLAQDALGIIDPTISNDTETHPVFARPPASNPRIPAPLSVETPAMSAPIVASVAAAVVPRLLEVLPWFAKSESAQRNVAAAQQIAPAILEAAKAASQQTGVAEAAQAVIDTPEVRERFVQAMALKWSDVQPMLEFDAKERREARDFGDRMTSSGPVARQWGFGLLISVLALAIVLGGGWMLWSLMGDGGLSPEQKGMVLGAMIATFTTVVQYFFGSSSGSRQKDVTIEQATRR